MLKRRGYMRDARERSDLASSPGGGEELTQQHFTEEVDINVIVKRFGLTGQLPTSGQAARAVYGDFTDIYDFESAVARIEEIEDRFMRLPAQFREQFENNPGRLVSFAESHSVEELEDVFGRATSPEPVVEAPVEPVP